MKVHLTARVTLVCDCCVEAYYVIQGEAEAEAAQPSTLGRRGIFLEIELPDGWDLEGDPEVLRCPDCRFAAITEGMAGCP